MGGSHGSGLMVLGLLMMLGGGGLAFWFARINNAHKAQALASQAWLSAPGQVVATEVKMTRIGGSVGRHSYQFTPLIAYHYTVGEHSYQGTRIRFGYLAFNTESGGQKVLIPYPVGTAVTVRYNPANPADSVLEAGAVTGNMQFGVIAAIGVAILGLLLVVAFRR